MQAAKAAHAWVSEFQAALDAKDADKITNLFTDDGWWRDMLTIDAVDFNSYRSEPDLVTIVETAAEQVPFSPQNNILKED